LWYSTSPAEAEWRDAQIIFPNKDVAYVTRHTIVLQIMFVKLKTNTLLQPILLTQFDYTFTCFIIEAVDSLVKFTFSIKFTDWPL